MTVEERIDKLEQAIPEIKMGIAEIKTILKERQVQEKMKDDSFSKEIAEINAKLDKALVEIPKIEEHEKRITKIEDGQIWLWRTVTGTILTTVIGAIIYVIKMM